MSEVSPISRDELAASFVAERPRLTRVAYATTGSLADAEDCVQEAWLRLQRVDRPDEIRDLAAWLTTTVARLALDALTSARARRESYVGEWLPEPVVELTPGSGGAPADPVDRVTLDESVSMALLVVLERLSAAERTAFVLHDVFGLEFEEVAGVVGRSPAAVRQLASRARRHIEDGRPRFEASAGQQRELVAAFADACARGDIDGLLAVLDPAVVWRGDGGGKVTATRLPQTGARRVADIAAGFTARGTSDVRHATVNGAPGLVLRDWTGVLTVISFTIDDDRIVAIDVMRNPDKLGRLAAQL